MARFAYQPILEENESYSKPGQIIMNRYNAHISINKNNIIVSITKEIEDKISDIDELKNEVDEQYDVVLNLIEDYGTFLTTTFADLTDARNILYAYDKKLLKIDTYLTDTNNGMKQKVSSINDQIIKLKQANDLQVSRNTLYAFNVKDLLSQIDVGTYAQSEYNKLIAMKDSYITV